MGRELKEIHLVKIYDRFSSDGGTVELQYRVPERASVYMEFSQSLWPTLKIGELPNEESVLNLDARVKFAKEYIAGIPEGYFSDENGKLISSDKNSENYRDDWKDLLEKHAADLLAALGEYIFERSEYSQRRILDAITNGVKVRIDTKKKTDSLSK